MNSNKLARVNTYYYTVKSHLKEKHLRNDFSNY